MNIQLKTNKNKRIKILLLSLNISWVVSENKYEVQCVLDCLDHDPNYTIDCTDVYKGTACKNIIRRCKASCAKH
ncbi:hypothetical protein DDB_G0273337 [Dictyostelium discoideum AX4]|uniref:ShKT domain-containing protein n=1 Tax=Dictyostelium discoideum TaxID=44689 RepID=Q556T0_DICDI|nr:hypothetical protein DDB_G0273845 [Dictyostelium discoideum AX4]XP_644711.1 hypothetical protein DDB_G0273337 [Dictyostelium discoideum AX4]EAL70613.1 hypothetical protein DDB_G0273845 [Dictyostelium discoideum AX4]EAL70886.1 hypothetical protein DDB_G0273337 [Dictyostelium discoideum AX4]|eukprot:XP_644539.1 hypothetical protein DDB_G0273845 [Dictyostelium discoideum AX4]